MKISDLKTVVGDVKTGEVAKIKFFGHINEYMIDRFNSEFEFLEKVIKPSRIDILINSEGGSVLHGMGAFAVIQNSTIPTRCINEGLAASMASVILVAGDETYIKDYAIIMIHQPFLPEDKNEEMAPAVKAFGKQLETIYHKRFGISKEKVKEIMEGKAGEDGTYFDAAQAVKAGIIAKENVIRTPKQNKANVKAALQGLTSVSALQNFFAELPTDNDISFKLCEVDNAIHNQEKASPEDTNETNQTNMADTPKEKETVGFVEASLATQMGITQFDAGSITARISALMGIEASYKELQTTNANLVTASAAQKESIENLTANLTDVQAKLQAYEEKETALKAKEIEAVVDKAITDGKIKAESKTRWVEAATNDLEMVKGLFADIAAREKISEEIANDPENATAAAEASKTNEQKLQEQIEAVVGTDFTFIKS